MNSVNRRVTDDQIRQCAEAGMTLAEAARHLGVSRAAVWKRTPRLGIRFKSNRRVFGHLTDAEMEDYRILSGARLTRDEALRAIGRGDLCEGGR